MHKNIVRDVRSSAVLSSIRKRSLLRLCRILQFLKGANSQEHQLGQRHHLRRYRDAFFAASHNDWFHAESTTRQTTPEQHPRTEETQAAVAVGKREGGVKNRNQASERQGLWAMWGMINIGTRESWGDRVYALSYSLPPFHEHNSPRRSMRKVYRSLSYSLPPFHE
ncbi:unnamed protein product [Ectocarpus fasciculatus]